jgi:hypothetical protein
MAVRWTSFAIALLGIAGCSETASTGASSLPRIAGDYHLAGVDGGTGNLPCCRQVDAIGSAAVLAGAVLHLSSDSASGTYRWVVVRDYQYANGNSQSIQSVFSVGAYTWDGRALTLTDSSGSQLGIGSVDGALITISDSAHQYLFWPLALVRH